MDNKLDTLEIHNFQSWEHGIFQFHPGMNIIKGNTGTGKTSVWRVLNWICVNSFRGDGYVPDWATSKTVVRGILKFTNGLVVERYRECKSGGDNGYKYQLPGQDIVHLLPKASTGVPKEIEDLLGLSDINFQGQEEGRFLISKDISAGEVARRLNKIVGIEIIDKVAAKIRSDKDGNESRLKALDKKIEEYSEKIQEYERYLPRYEQLVSDLETKVSTKLELHKQCIDLGRHLNSINDIMERVSANTAWLEVEGKVDRLAEHYTRLNQLRGDQVALENRLRSISWLEARLEEGNKRLQSEEKINTLNEIVTTLLELTRTNSTIANSLANVEAIQNRIKHKGSRLAQEEKALAELRAQVTQCPVFDLVCPVPMEDRK